MNSVQSFPPTEEQLACAGTAREQVEEGSCIQLLLSESSECTEPTHMIHGPGCTIPHTQSRCVLRAAACLTHVARLSQGAVTQWSTGSGTV